MLVSLPEPGCLGKPWRLRPMEEAGEMGRIRRNALSSAFGRMTRPVACGLTFSISISIATGIVIGGGTSQASDRSCRVSLQSENGAGVELVYGTRYLGPYLVLAPFRVEVRGSSLQPSDQVQVLVRGFDESGLPVITGFELPYDTDAGGFSTGARLFEPGRNYPELVTSELVSVILNGRTLIDPETRKPYSSLDPYRFHAGTECSEAGGGVALSW